MESDQAKLTLACGLERARMAVTQPVVQKARVLGARHESYRPEATRQAIGHATFGAFGRRRINRKRGSGEVWAVPSVPSQHGYCQSGSGHSQCIDDVQVLISRNLA